jgi:PRTRC genetic system ThiF family protein
MITLTHEKRYRLQIGAPDIYRIYLVGCGGTGSFLALHLARLAYHVRERYGREVRLTFIDPDRVEDKNIGRQNFCPAEIGAYKAHTLMRRYNAAFGLDIQAVCAPFASSMTTGRVAFRLLVGAVDNAAARRELQTAATVMGGATWWLDCGNHEHAGQVLLGNRADLRAPEIALGFCGGLPLPSVQAPELLEANSELRMTNGESCAELALRDAQSLMVNQMAAGWAASYVYRLLIGKDLDVYATYFDLVSAAARSLPIVRPEAV